MLDAEYFGNSARAWATALIIALVVALGLRALVAVLVRRLTRLTSRTSNDLDDIVVAMLASTKLYFVGFLGIWAGTRGLILPAQLTTVLRFVTVFVVVFQVAAWANVGITAFIRGRIRKTIEADPAEATTLAALSFIIRLALWAVLLLAGLSNLDIEIGPLLTGLGVGGIAVALAVQNILGDLFASLSIVLDKPFVLGDFIVVGDQAGTIEHIGLKTTRVRSLSGEQLIFANSDLLSSRIRNFKRMAERRIPFSIGVTYQTQGSTLERIPGILREAVERQGNTRFDRSHLKEFGDFAITFETVYFVTDPDYNLYMNVQHDINLEIHRRFQEEGVDFAYPTQTVFLARPVPG